MAVLAVCSSPDNVGAQVEAEPLPLMGRGAHRLEEWCAALDAISTLVTRLSALESIFTTDVSCPFNNTLLCDAGLCRRSGMSTLLLAVYSSPKLLKIVAR